MARPSGYDIIVTRWPSDGRFIHRAATEVAMILVALFAAQSCDLPLHRSIHRRFTSDCDALALGPLRAAPHR